MKLSVQNFEGEAMGEVEVADAIFARPWNASLVRQVLVAEQANKRDPWAHTKDRSEVSGGGKKPWKQKHTGRSRHGSIRSPIWKGGGATHGPRNSKDYSKKVNKTMKRMAIHAALSRKLKDGELFIINSFALPATKTKELIKKVGKASSMLFVGAKGSGAIARIVKNISRMDTIPAASLNLESILKFKKVYVEQAAIGEIK